jgi:hypothetical protein
VLVFCCGRSCDTELRLRAPACVSSRAEVRVCAVVQAPDGKRNGSIHVHDVYCPLAILKRATCLHDCTATNIDRRLQVACIVLYNMRQPASKTHRPCVWRHG